MENSLTLKGVCKQLGRIFSSISDLTDEIDNVVEQKSQDLTYEYADMRMQELEQAQRLIIVLTEMIVDNTDMIFNKASADNTDEDDGSVFAEGELTDKLGSKAQKKAADCNENSDGKKKC